MFEDEAKETLTEQVKDFVPFIGDAITIGTAVARNNGDAANTVADVAVTYSLKIAGGIFGTLLGGPVGGAAGVKAAGMLDRTFKKYFW